MVWESLVNSSQFRILNPSIAFLINDWEFTLCLRMFTVPNKMIEGLIWSRVPQPLPGLCGGWDVVGRSTLSLTLCPAVTSILSSPPLSKIYVESSMRLLTEEHLSVCHPRHPGPILKVETSWTVRILSRQLRLSEGDEPWFCNCWLNLDARQWKKTAWLCSLWRLLKDQFPCQFRFILFSSPTRTFVALSDDFRAPSVWSQPEKYKTSQFSQQY